MAWPNFVELRKSEVQLRRNPLPRTPVNRDHRGRVEGEELYLTISQLGATTSLRSARTLCGVHSCSATYAAYQPVAWRKFCRSPCHASASISLPATLAMPVNWLRFLLRWPQRALANG